MAGGTITTKNIAPAAPADLERKTSAAAPESGLLDADDATGVVEAIVSVTGICDDVNDVIEPGAYAKTLKQRRAKGIFHHDWSRWAARTEEIRELMPGDPGLPKETKDGKPWPPEAGGLYVKTRFNLRTQEGRDAYENVKFFSETGECDWSIGYKVPRGASTRDKAGVRHIKEIDLFEYSPVLFGAAGSFSGTLSVKAADVAAVEEPATDDADTTEEPAGDPAAEAAEDPADDTATPEERGESEAAEDGPAEEEPEPAEEPPAVPEPEEEEETPAAAQAVDWDALDQAADAITGTDDGDDDNQESKRFIPQGKRRGMAKQGTAMPDGSFPIANVQDLKNAIAAIGRAKDPAAARRHIMKRAAALNASNLIPDSWKSGGESKMAHEPLDRSPKKNWVEMAGQLPAYIQHIARDLHEKRGMPLERAIPTAIAAVKRWAAGAGDVKADTRAKAQKAVAEWEALKAKSHARSAARRAVSSAKSADLYDIDPAADDAADAEPTHPLLPGTYEELREQLTTEAAKAFGGGDGEARFLVDVIGTWPDRFVAACFPMDEKGVPHAIEVPYSVEEDGLFLGEGTQVKLAVETDDGEVIGEQELLPYPTLLDDVTAGVKSHLVAHMEDKAGRVLSGANATRLKSAVENLVAVLEAAGVHINTPEREEEPTEGAVQPDSTAPSAQGDAFTVPTGKKIIDPELMARAYRIIGDVHTG